MSTLRRPEDMTCSWRPSSNVLVSLKTPPLWLNKHSFPPLPLPIHEKQNEKHERILNLHGDSHQPGQWLAPCRFPCPLSLVPRLHLLGSLTTSKVSALCTVKISHSPMGNFQTINWHILFFCGTRYTLRHLICRCLNRAQGLTLWFQNTNVKP